MLLLFGAMESKASLVPSNGDVRTWNNSSYSTDIRFSGVTFLSFWPNMYPGTTNQFADLSRSGESWGGWYQSEEEKWGLPVWVSHTNLNALVALYYPADDNGGYDTNSIVTNWFNIVTAPTNFWNGTAITNEGYKFPIDFEALGAYPHDSSDGDSGEISRNAGCIGLQNFYSKSPVDLWHNTWTNGWQTDVVGNRVLGFSTGSHPYQGGFVAGTIAELTALGADTNVGTVTIDGSAFISLTNHFTTSTITNTGNGVSFVAHADRMPFGWIEQAGTITNQGSMCFQAIPRFSTWFTWNIQGTNFPSGIYTITADGITIGTTTTSGGIFTFNMFTNTVGPWWNQRATVINKFLDLEGADHTTLITHSAGQEGVLGVDDMVNYKSRADGFYDTSGQRGATFVASMASSTAEVEQYDAAIYVSAQQTNHLITITLPPTFLHAPFRP